MSRDVTLFLEATPDAGRRCDHARPSNTAGPSCLYRTQPRLSLAAITQPHSDRPWACQPYV
jgi:hypothetical protein